VGKSKQKPIDVVKAEAILEEDHYGLEKVKERILEYLAVQAAPLAEGSDPLPRGRRGRQDLARPLVAKATGREFVRLSLGGVRDEAEIRGTGAPTSARCPQDLQSMKKAKTTNTFLLLDEIDRWAPTGGATRSSALLEGAGSRTEQHLQRPLPGGRLRPQQVMFVTPPTALNMPQPLMDRMEIIRLPATPRTRRWRSPSATCCRSSPRTMG